MENLVNKVQKVLDINVTSYRISKITGITELVLSKYRKGTYNVKNMSLETADKLISNRSEIEKYAKGENMARGLRLRKFWKGGIKMTFEEDEIGGYCNPISDWDEYAEMWFMEGRNDIWRSNWNNWRWM